MATTSTSTTRVASTRTIMPPIGRRAARRSAAAAVPTPPLHTIAGVPIPQAIPPRVAFAPAPPAQARTVITRSGRSGTATHPQSGIVVVHTGGTVGGTSAGGYANPLSGDVLGRLGISLPRALEVVALVLAVWLVWRYGVKGGK